MSITEQYFLDMARAQRRGEPLPPAPGSHDWQAMRELRGDRPFRAVQTVQTVQAARARQDHGRVQAALTRLFRQFRRFRQPKLFKPLGPGSAPQSRRRLS
ncbi:hypothetical protein G5C60_22185 [Streptomyces sp. HC44]|uniref:Uncharacterized protein n=1 Tax=Streptomyces scabichelini TaxID=2711217 RepID=A0A6G4V7Z9_9ACTN|nr:hypothetical protein [Streptomyces scabichelini]NGO10222.1 hypothetical protein [Streptomyces scabichelini]